MNDTPRRPGRSRRTAAGAPETAAEPFVDRWQRLVSTTNWEKGRILHEWRTALVAAEAPSSEYSDDAWSRRVGGVTPQHVGRLRRVFEQFGTSYEQFPGLSWSHFYSALDWPDPEMWLEGAVQSGWSVAQMRGQRWETLGGAEADRPRNEDVVSVELDEDFVPVAMAEGESTQLSPGQARDLAGEEAFGPDFGDEPRNGEPQNGEATAGPYDGSFNGDDNADRPEPKRPFAALPELPADLAEAFDSFKLAILHHKVSGWSKVARDDVLFTLDALKELALAEDHQAH